MNLLNQEKIKYRNICFTTEGRLRCRHIFTNWQFLLKMWNTFEHFLRYMLLTLERCCKPQRRFLIRLSIACFLDHPLLPGLNDMAWIGLHSIRVLQRVLVQIYIYTHHRLCLDTVRFYRFGLNTLHSCISITPSLLT